jgi:putative FmdB family regulatory protein
MPIYEYEHLKRPCKIGKVFDFKQSLSDDPIKACPHCKGPVQKIISQINISCPRTNGELRDLGFTKLVKRDDGVYENVTGVLEYWSRVKIEWHDLLIWMSADQKA